MNRADSQGLGVAVFAHLALLAVLTIGISRRVPPVRPTPQTMDVQLVDAVGLQSASPSPATEAPREQVAPETGPPEEAPAPSPEPQPVPVPKTVADPTPAPPQPKPTPAPAPAKEPKKVAPVKPTPGKDTKKVQPAKPAPRLSSDFLKDLSSAAKSEAKGASAGKGQRTTGSKLGPDFLKGIAGPAAGKGTTARASITGPAMNGLAAAIKRQVQPCYELGALGGTPAMSIVTVLQLRFNKDGSVASAQVVEQTGVDGSNARYKQQMAEVSRAAVLRCAPLRLPSELYAGGWENIEMGFIPRQMQ